VFFALIFVLSAFNLFSSGSIAYAESRGVPAAALLVPVAGVLALLGGLSIALGFRAKLGAWLIVIFLVPVTLMLHQFWGIADPMAHQTAMINFLKNLSMLGGALLIAHFGPGPMSFDGCKECGSDEAAPKA
jgi:putative oxidoreductase